MSNPPRPPQPSLHPELDDVDLAWDDDEAVFDRVTAVPDEPTYNAVLAAAMRPSTAPSAAPDSNDGDRRTPLYDEPPSTRRMSTEPPPLTELDDEDEFRAPMLTEELMLPYDDADLPPAFGLSKPIPAAPIRVPPVPRGAVPHLSSGPPRAPGRVPSDFDLKLELDSSSLSPLELADRYAAPLQAVVKPQRPAPSRSIPELQAVEEPVRPERRQRDSLELDVGALAIPTLPNEPARTGWGTAPEQRSAAPRPHTPPPILRGARGTGIAIASEPPPSPQPTTDPRLATMRDRYAMGDFTGALVVAEAILEDDGEEPEANGCAANCRQVLEKMYAARLGDLSRVPRVAVPPDQIRWLSLDHRSGFLLSMLDGESTVEELFDVCGMPRLEALRILHGLVEQRVVQLTKAR